MEYLLGIHRIERRRDAYTSLPLSELIEIGHSTDIALSDLPGLVYSSFGKNEIAIEPAINDRLHSLVRRPSFVWCGFTIYLLTTSYQRDVLIEAFSKPTI
jgi:hypothetical protein